MKLTLALLLLAGVLSAQNKPANPLIASSRTVFNVSKNDVLGSIDKVGDDLWFFQPTPQIRTFGQLFAHIADGQYEFCGVAREGKVVSKDIEKNVKTRAEVIAALKEAFAYCDAAYDSFTDAKATETVRFFGMELTLLAVLDFNSAHNMEHYGNLVTYMRLKNIVPPSSAPPPAAAGKK